MEGRKETGGKRLRCIYVAGLQKERLKESALSFLAGVREGVREARKKRRKMRDGILRDIRAGG